jgi:transcriptional regulator with XRE-family HTH domain
MAKGWMKRSYRLIDHDPEIDKFKTLWRQERLKEADFAMLAGLSVQTVSKMFGNETKRPQHLTFQKMATAMGYEYTLTREITPVYATEIPKARAEFKEHQEELRKKRERAAKKNGK